jgi:hypothetical protein
MLSTRKSTFVLWTPYEHVPTLWPSDVPTGQQQLTCTPVGARLSKLLNFPCLALALASPSAANLSAPIPEDQTQHPLLSATYTIKAHHISS